MWNESRSRLISTVKLQTSYQPKPLRLRQSPAFGGKAVLALDKVSATVKYGSTCPSLGADTSVTPWRILARCRFAALGLVAALTLLMLVASSLALAEEKPPAEGKSLPAFELPVPQDALQRNYLGLSESGQFSIPQIKARVVIIQVFSMY